MQTFLPEINFHDCAAALDSKRLNKQILETYQILNVLCNNSPSKAWKNHPAVLMWKGHEGRLYTYALAMVAEAKKRGIKTDKNFANLYNLYIKYADKWSYEKPRWETDHNQMNRIIWTHKANLYKKDSEYYFDFHDALSNVNNQPCCDKCKYYWVTHKEKNV